MEYPSAAYKLSQNERIIYSSYIILFYFFLFPSLSI